MEPNTTPATNARFFVHTWPNRAESKKAGRPIYSEMECVEITHPGDKLTKKVFPATEICGYHDDEETGFREPLTYAMRFKDQYRQFKNGRTQTLAGTPLEELTFLTQSKRLELKALSIYTAEQLAALDGQPLKQIGMGGRELKNQAQAYLDKAAETVDVTTLAAENAELRRRLETLEAGRYEPGDPQSAFSDWDDEALKEWIKDATGKRPVGNPARATLIRMADEINVDLKAKEDAAAKEGKAA